MIALESMLVGSEVYKTMRPGEVHSSLLVGWWSESTLAVASDTNQDLLQTAISHSVVWVMKAAGFEKKKRMCGIKKMSGSAASILICLDHLQSYEELLARFRRDDRQRRKRQSENNNGSSSKGYSKTGECISWREQ